MLLPVTLCVCVLLLPLQARENNHGRHGAGRGETFALLLPLPTACCYLLLSLYNVCYCLLSVLLRR